MTHTTIHISARSIFMTLGIFFGLFVLYQVRDIIVTLFLALIIMSALNPGVNKLERKKIPRPLGIVLLYLAVLGFLILLFGIVVPPLASELSNMIKYLQPSSIPVNWAEFEFTFQDLSSILGQVGTSLSSVLNVITTTFSSIFFVFTLLVMSFYLLMQRNHLHLKITWLPLPKKFEELFDEFLANVEIQLGGWVRGELMLMFSVGLATYIGLTALSIPYALPLAVLAGFLELLPNIGPTIAAVPAVLIAFIMLSPTMAFIVLLMYLIIQQIENNVLVPRIMKAAVNVEPLTSILLILAGIKLAGVTGALLAIPFYILLRSGIQIYHREKN